MQQHGSAARGGRPPVAPLSSPPPTHLAMTAKDVIIPAEDVELTGDVLGSGRFGEVRGALWLGQPVAVKRIVPAAELTPDLRAHLEGETAALMPHLQHPNLLPLYGLTESPTTQSLYLVVKKCQGGSVRSLVRKLRGEQRLMPLASTLHVAKGVASALAFLHSQSPPLVYRDLKTGSILLTDSGNVQLDCELGILKSALDLAAAIASRTSPPEGHALDSAYAAPELFSMGVTADRAADGGAGVHAQSSVGSNASIASGMSGGAAFGLCQPAVDIFSFASCLWEMVTGRAPYTGFREPQIIQAMLGQAWPPIPDTVPEPLRRILQACWQSDPAARPTARQLLRMVREAECALQHAPQPPLPPAAAVAIAVPDVPLSGRQRSKGERASLGSVFGSGGASGSSGGGAAAAGAAAAPGDGGGGSALPPASSARGSVRALFGLGR